jgi:hypothetical protein
MNQYVKGIQKYNFIISNSYKVKKKEKLAERLLNSLLNYRIKTL